METTVHTLQFKGQSLELADSKVSEFAPEHVKAWTFEHTPYTGGDAVEVGLKLAEAKIGPAFGTDAETVAIAKGKLIAERIVTSPANPGSLPPGVLKQFGRRLTVGIYPTDEELAALKAPTTPSSGTTTLEGG